MRDGILAIIVHDGKLLLLKRSSLVSGYNGWWYGVGGRIEDGESAESAAYREIAEETGLKSNQLRLVKIGKPLMSESGRVWPFIFESTTDRIQIDWEHDQFVWARPEELCRYRCVPTLLEALKQLGSVV